MTTKHVIAIETKMIPLTLIREPKFNSRMEPVGAEATKAEAARIAYMAEQFNDPKIGQEQPIKVQYDPEAKDYIRIIGSRRVKAAKLAGWSEIRAEVHPLTDEATQAIQNGVENLERENLTTYEVARLCSHYRSMGMDNKAIAPLVHMSHTNVSNWVTMYNGVPAKVAKAWQAGAAAATFNNLGEVARNKGDDDAKLQAWDELVLKVAKENRQPGKRGKGAKNKPEAEPGKGGGGGGFPLSQVRFKRVYEALQSKKTTPSLSDDLRAWAISLCKFIMSGVDVVGGVVDLNAEAKAKEAAKAADKAAKEAAKAAEKATKDAAKAADAKADKVPTSPVAQA